MTHGLIAVLLYTHKYRSTKILTHCFSAILLYTMKKIRNTGLHRKSWLYTCSIIYTETEKVKYSEIQNYRVTQAFTAVLLYTQKYRNTKKEIQENGVNICSIVYTERKENKSEYTEYTETHGFTAKKIAKKKLKFVGRCVLSLIGHLQTNFTFFSAKC